MENIVVPTTTEIFSMSSMRCRARSDETTGGPSNIDRIAALKAALEQIEDRLEALTGRVAA